MTQESSPKGYQDLCSRMRAEWDRRVAHDYRYWMSDGVASDREMWAVGERDFGLVALGLDPNVTKDQCVLELGCGVGRLLRAASKRFGRVIGVDISETALGQACELLQDTENIELVLGNGSDISGVPSQLIDVAYSFAALGSMPVSVVAGYLLELSRVLRPGGLARLQVYLGRAQDTFQEDTLAIRAFSKDCFINAATAAGFSVQAVEELILPFEVSDPERGSIAYLVALEKKSEASVGLAEIVSLLSPEGERQAGATWIGSETEYFMAVARAQQHLDAGESKKAEAALEYAVQCYASPEKDVLEILQGLKQRNQKSVSLPIVKGDMVIGRVPEATSIVSGSGSAEFLYRNLEVARARFPSAAATLENTTVSPELEVRRNSQGAVVFRYRGTPLIHEEKPQRAAETWAEQSLNTVHVREAKILLLVGWGSGYQLEELLRRAKQAVYVYEPNPEVLKGVLEKRDLRSAFDRLSGVFFSIEEIRRVLQEPMERGDVAALVLPQTKVLHATAVDDVQRMLISARGLNQIQPRIAVVGPMYGGSLPIARYTNRALLGLRQRATGYDLSGFFQGFKDIGGFLKTKSRKDAIESQYVEMLSRAVLEGMTERPVDIMICLAQAPMSPEVLLEARKRGIITVMWFVEDCNRFQTWKQLAPYFDYMFLIQRGEFLKKVEAAGAGRAIYLPVGCDPDVHCPVELTEDERKRYGSDISFLGAGYNNRRHMFANLANRDFKIWGTEWPDCMPFNRLLQDQGRRIEPEEYNKIFNASAINLNLHSSMERDSVEPNGDFVNPRTYELASAGAFQLVDERTLLGDQFEVGKEVAVFHDGREMQDSIDYYLAHPEERQRFINAARSRAMSEHTYQHRVKSMLEYIYADRLEHLKSRQGTGPWQTTLSAAKDIPELHKKLQSVYERGDEPQLDALLADVQTGKGSLSEMEQKLLFLHHLRAQIVHIQEQRNEKRNNILVVAITRMGDMLQASPTFEGFKRENPNCRITVLIDKQFAAICTGLPGIDEVYVLELNMVMRSVHRGADGLVEAYRYVSKVVDDLREREFDYVLNMSSSPYTALLLKMVDAPQNRGWMADEEGFRLITDPWAMLFAAFVYHSNREYNALNLVDILRCSAGVKEHPNHLVYRPTEEERSTANEMFRAQGISGEGPIVAIQAGASQEKRQWPPANFAKVVQLLTEQYGARVLFVGSGGEKWIFDDVQKRFSSPKLFSAMGKTTFGELAAILEKVDVLITGDTGPMHMAVSVGTPVVALFLASALCFETGPYGPGNFVMQPQIACNPCNPNFPCARPDCHAQITPELVAYLADLRLKTPRGSEHSIRLPDEYRNQQQVAIYNTAFDEDGFLEFQLMGGAAPRNGESAGFYKTARDSYKALWKEEFDEIPFRSLAPNEERLPLPHPALRGVNEILRLVGDGNTLVKELSDLVQNPQSPIGKLKEVNGSLQEVDRKLEEVGLSFPLIGAIIRIFLMEKDNLRGDDVLQLASETKELYARLARRGRRFANLFEHFESEVRA